MKLHEKPRPHATAHHPEIAAAPTQDEAPIHVRHNRKSHLDPETSPAVAADPAPHKLTSEDFMTSHAGQSAEEQSAPASPARIASVVERPAPTVESAQPPAITPVLYNKRGRLIVPPALKGSTEILVHQNAMADQEGLGRVQDDEDLERLRGKMMLVALPASSALQIDERLPFNRRYCRPWTAEFLAALARAHYARFHSPLQVNSAVRTVEFQERLQRTNGNAAGTDGERASPHLTGQAVDLAKHGLSMTEIAWLRGYLLPLVQQGKVDVEEEFQQACFHISVYKKYMPEAAPKREIAPHRDVATSLAAAVR